MCVFYHVLITVLMFHLLAICIGNLPCEHIFHLHCGAHCLPVGDGKTGKTGNSSRSVASWLLRAYFSDAYTQTPMHTSALVLYTVQKAGLLMKSRKAVNRRESRIWRPCGTRKIWMIQPSLRSSESPFWSLACYCTGAFYNV